MFDFMEYESYSMKYMLDSIKFTTNAHNPDSMKYEYNSIPSTVFQQTIHLIH